MAKENQSTEMRLAARQEKKMAWEKWTRESLSAIEKEGSGRKLALIQELDWCNWRKKGSQSSPLLYGITWKDKEDYRTTITEPTDFHTMTSKEQMDYNTDKWFFIYKVKIGAEIPPFPLALKRRTVDEIRKDVVVYGMAPWESYTQ